MHEITEVDNYDKLSYIEMILIGKKIIAIFAGTHPDSRRPLAAWEQVIKITNYASFNELKRTFPSVDYVSHQYTIFDISGNKFRLVTEINYIASVVNVKRIWTHAEYSMSKTQEALRGNKI